MKKFFIKNLIIALAGVVLAFAGCSADSGNDDSPTQYTVSYQSEHGTAPAPKTIESGKTLTSDYLPDLTADGYSFNGWKLDGAAIPDGYTVTKNITLVASWTESIQTFTITYETEYGTKPNSMTIVSGTVISDTYLPSLSADDYVFEGWTLKGSETVITASSNKTVTENITLVAKWRAFDPNNDVIYKILHKQESVDGSANVTVNTETKTTTKGNLSVTITPKAYDGFDSPNAETKSVESDGTSEFVLIYTRKTIVLTLQLDGGSGDESLSGKYGAAVTAPANPTKDGYTFAAWNPSLPETFPAENATYTATWTAVQQEVPQDKTVKVQNIEISGSTTVAKGGSVTLKATVTPSNATNKTISWSADVAAGVTLVGGKLTVDDTCAASKISVTAKATDESGVESKPFEVTVVDISSVSAGITITEEKGWLESLYIKWSPATSDVIDGYNVYVKETGGEYAKLDDMLVRAYSNTAGGTTIDYYRADALGLKAGTYQMKVVGTASGVEASGVYAESKVITVEAHDRSGFAFTGTTTPGAYNADGTLKDNAVVIYLTDKTKETVTMDVVTGSKNKTEKKVGIIEILLGYKKGYETRPLAIRVVGEVKDWSVLNTDKNTKGDLVIENNNTTVGITMEGVGEDAVANGWGLRFKNADYGEARNLAFINCHSDEGDNIGLQQDNNYIWVHNCDMFYGNAGSDKDQVKGDGALDCKKSNYVTFSYNHFWDNGKCNLLGLSEGVKSTDSNPYYITYHHNWYDHSDSRHPRVRYYNAHIYNNYYDGNAKYGAGSTLGSSLFVESNYFRNCKNPMMTSMQGTDVYAGGTKRDPANLGTFSKEDGGVIKAYNNYMTGTYTFIPYGATSYVAKGSEVTASAQGITTTADYDAYVVDSRTATVPNTIVSYQGSNYYSNFDTASSFYSYTADSPEDAKANVEKYAGRMNGGDLHYTFNNSVEDTNYIVIDELKSLVTNYKTKLVKVLGSDASSSGSVDGNTGEDEGGSGDSGNSGNTTTGTTIASSVECVFTGNKVSNSAFTVTGNYSNSKGSVTVNDTTYTICVKMESSTSITFTTDKTMNLKLVFASSETGKKVKVDGTDYTTDSTAIVTVSNLGAGSHTITKGDSINLFYIGLSE